LDKQSANQQLNTNIHTTVAAVRGYHPYRNIFYICPRSSILISQNVTLL